MLVTICNLGTNSALYTDPGADYYTRMRPDRTNNAHWPSSPASATESPSRKPPDHNYQHTTQ